MIQIDGHPWSVAISGAWMFAVRGGSSYKPMTDVTELVPRLLSASSQGGEEIETRRLREWAGPLPADRDFLTEGVVEGVIFGKVFDLRRLACLLEHVMFPKLTVWDSTTLMGVASLGLESRGKWRAYLAGVSSDPDSNDPSQKFWDSRPEGAAAFDLMSQLRED